MLQALQDIFLQAVPAMVKRLESHFTPLYALPLR